MTTYASECSIYVGLDDGSTQAIIDQYAPPITNGRPQPLGISVTLPTDSVNLNQVLVSFGQQADTIFIPLFSYNLTYDLSGNVTITRPPPSGIRLTVNGPVNIVTIEKSDPTILLKNQYVPEDTYTLNLQASCSQQFKGIQATLNRPAPSRTFGGTPTSSNNPNNNNNPDGIPCTDCSCLVTDACKKVNIPIVNILGQVTVDYSDIGDVIFTICDKYQYYDCEKITSCENKCVIEYIKSKRFETN